MDEESKVTLLRRGFLVPQKGATDYQRAEMKSAIPREYIIQSIKLRQEPSRWGDRVTILKAGTGGGKSITLPPSMMWRRKRIALTEPSRLSVEEIAIDLARRNPELKMGETLGFQTGIINKSPSRGVVVMTTGILQQHLINLSSEQFMRRYSTLIIDEVHKHDIITDFLLRSLKTFLQQRWKNPECPILILMSATMEPSLYASYFETPHVIEVRGTSSNPIKEVWPSNAVTNLEDAIAALAPTLKGDTLVFMPTVKSIESLHAKLKDRKVIEIYSELLERGAGETRALAHADPNGRIILATNAAETGVTFPHLDNLIDTGYAFNVAFNPQLNARVMFVGPISQASAMQRRGRVGRTKPGAWYPMYSKAVFSDMQMQPFPEILTQDMSGHILKHIVMTTDATPNDDFTEIKSSAAFDIGVLNLINAPSSEMVQHCVEKLYILGFLDGDQHVTLSGWIAAQFTILDVQELRLILGGLYHKCDVFSCIVMACCASIEGTKKLGILPLMAGDGFISALLTYEQLMKKIHIVKRGSQLSTRMIEDWCVEKGLNFNAWMQVLELIDETTLKLMECGFAVTGWGPSRVSLTDQIESKTQTAEIQRLKTCIMEAYRLQMCTWNEKMGAFISDSRGHRLNIRGVKAMNIVCNTFEYKRAKQFMEFSAGKLVSVCDGFVDIDKRFLY